MNSVMHCILILAVMSVINFMLRSTPFFLFSKEKKTPEIVSYLGKVLPAAMMSFLVIYCIRSVDISSGNHGIPEILGILTAMGLHAWKRNTLLSISAATLIYMILIQMVF